MRAWRQWALGAGVMLVVIGVPAAYYRAMYAHAKRLRVVAEGKLYRSGQLTANGLRDAVRLYGIRTVINLQEENVDPYMPEAWLGKPSIRESDLCEEYGINYYALFGGETLPQERFDRGERPKVIDQFLQILDDPKNYPVLLHCKAGLHRTGLLTAVYRIEYECWPTWRAVDELRANGFGTFAATTGNIYLVQYIDRYQKGLRKPVEPPKRGKPVIVEVAR